VRPLSGVWMLAPILHALSLAALCARDEGIETPLCFVPRSLVCSYPLVAGCDVTHGNARIISERHRWLVLLHQDNFLLCGLLMTNDSWYPFSG
jgi:hypothetical protein